MHGFSGAPCLVDGVAGLIAQPSGDLLQIFCASGFGERSSAAPDYCELIFCERHGSSGLPMISHEPEARLPIGIGVIQGEGSPECLKVVADTTSEVMKHGADNVCVVVIDAAGMRHLLLAHSCW